MRFTVQKGHWYLGDGTFAEWGVFQEGVEKAIAVAGSAEAAGTIAYGLNLYSPTIDFSKEESNKLKSISNTEDYGVKILASIVIILLVLSFSLDPISIMTGIAGLIFIWFLT